MLDCCHSESFAVILSEAKNLALRIFMSIRDSSSPAAPQNDSADEFFRGLDSPLKTQASCSDDVSPPWGYPHAGAAGLRGQPFDKYSELTEEGKQYSYPKAPNNLRSGGRVPRAGPTSLSRPKLGRSRPPPGYISTGETPTSVQPCGGG